MNDCPFAGAVIFLQAVKIFDEEGEKT